MVATAQVQNQPLVSAYSRSAFSLIAVCFVLSGATGLIYEVLWARMLGLVFGATTIAISAVLSAFMGGLALGSEVAGRAGKQLHRPLRSYGLIEIGVGLYALAVPLFFRGIDSVYATFWLRFHSGFYGFALSRFLLAFVVLAVPTTLMGATLPVLAAALSRAHSEATSIARFYTYNLIGAIGGAVVAGFVLLPSFGVRATIWIAAGINLVIGLSAIIIDVRSAGAPAGGLTASLPVASSDPAVEIKSSRHSPFWLSCAFISGFVTFSVQVTWSRLLAMIIGSSTYAFSIVVAIFLAGLALGAYLVSSNKISAKHDEARLRRAVFALEVFTAGALFISIWITNIMPALLMAAGFQLQVDSWPGLLALQICAATLLVLIPAVLMGTVMPMVLLWAGTVRQVDSNETLPKATVAGAVGRSYAVNTLGAIAGSMATAFLLIPLAGTRFTILFAISLSLGLAGVAYLPSREKADRATARALAVGISAALIFFTFVAGPHLNVAALSIGAYDSYVRVLAKARGGTPEKEAGDAANEHRVLMFKEGATATVSVRRDWGITSLAINGRTNASDRDDMPTQVMVGQIGVLTAPRLNNALIVGFATGVTAGSVLQSPVTSVECVEIEPAAVASSHYFDHVNNQPLNDPRARVVIDDARTRLRVNPNRYDLIVSEPSHPWVPGVANLFTREFFTLGRERLQDDGVFVQWLQIYQLSTESLRSVLATFHEVFPHVMIFRVRGDANGKDLIMVGSRASISLDHLTERLNNPRIAADLNRVGVKSVDDFKAWYVCDETQLGPAVKGAIINMDDNMHVETVAPREVFRPSMEENAAWIENLRRH